MAGPGFLPREAQLAQDLAQAGDVIAMAEPGCDQIGNVSPGPARQAITLRIRATQDQPPQRRLLTFAQTRGPYAGTVAQPADPFGVVAHHRIAQRLAFHAGQPCGLRTRQAFQRMGYGIGPRSRARVWRPPRPHPQGCRRSVSSDRQRHSPAPPLHCRQRITAASRRGSKMRVSSQAWRYNP